MSSLTRLS